MIDKPTKEDLRLDLRAIYASAFPLRTNVVQAIIRRAFWAEEIVEAARSYLPDAGDLYELVGAESEAGYSAESK